MTQKDNLFSFKQAIESAMDGIAFLDQNGHYYYMNQSHALIFGYTSPQELIGKKWHQLYSDNEIIRIKNQIFPELLKNSSWKGETLGKKKDDSPVYQEVTLTLLPDGGLVCICRDISKRKSNELLLKRLAYVAEKTNSIVMITDPQRRILWINNSFETILGYSIDEVRGINPANFLQGPETSVETIKTISQSLRDIGKFSGEILNYKKNGDKIWLNLNISAVYGENGNLINFVAVENDITPFKMAEQQLQIAMEKERKLNRLKSQFVTMASHQFRTPLATFRSSLDLLDLKMESYDLDSTFLQFFQKHKTIMVEETIRMTELMENILEFGRIDEEKIRISREAQSFKQFMDDFVRSNVEPDKQQRKLNYYFKAQDKIICMDGVLLRNVLRNIVSNAYKYSEGKKAPDLTVTFKKNAYLIKIKDYGIGIPEKDLALLFQPFFRASNVKNFSGNGLGLMIAKKLIQLHGGDISCESKVEKGCSVTIRLPTNKKTKQYGVT